MTSHKKTSARKGTKPFMPIHGKKRACAANDEKVMKVSPEDVLDQSGAECSCGGGCCQEAEQSVPGEQSYDEVVTERDTYLELARRERADFDNYRKRVERDMRAIKRESLSSFLQDFFGPLSDLDRVLQESEKSQSFEALATGVKLMEENFWRVLEKAGVTKIEAMGQPFDPVLHEAMAAVPAAGTAPNTVLEVYENGYKMDDHVLRPAKVVVSKTPDE